jgi:hypothetical protein
MKKFQEYLKEWDYPSPPPPPRRKADIEQDATNTAWILVRDVENKIMEHPPRERELILRKFISQFKDSIHKQGLLDGGGQDSFYK